MLTVDRGFRTSRKAPPPPLTDSWAERLPMPIAKLKNGLRIANFGLAFVHIFADSTKLEGCSNERVRALLLNQPTIEKESPCKRWKDVRLSLQAPLPPRVVAELERVAGVYAAKGFDVVLMSRNFLDQLFVMLRRDDHGFSPALCNMITQACRLPQLRDRERNLYHTDQFALPS